MTTKEAVEILKLLLLNSEEQRYGIVSISFSDREALRVAIKKMEEDL